MIPGRGVVPGASSAGAGPPVLSRPNPRPAAAARTWAAAGWHNNKDDRAMTTSTKPRPALTPGEARAYPVLPLRDIVVFPHMIVPLFVGREKSIRALEEVMRNDTYILLATQKNASDDDPAPAAIYEVGTLASVLQLLKLPDGTVKVLVEGAERTKILKYTARTDYYEAEAEVLADTVGDAVEAEAMSRSVVTEFQGYVKLNKKVSPEVVGVVQQISDYGKIADTVASHLAVKIADKQGILETTAVSEGDARAQEAAPDVADVARIHRRAQLSRLAVVDPMGQGVQDQEEPHARPKDPRRRPLRPGEGQGADRRVSRGPAARQQADRPDPVPGRSSRRRQDFARQVDRPGDRPRLRARLARRRARRGGDPRPSPHLHRLDARKDHPVDAQGEVQQSAVPARRS